MMADKNAWEKLFAEKFGYGLRSSQDFFVREVAQEGEIVKAEILLVPDYLEENGDGIFRDDIVFFFKSDGRLLCEGYWLLPEKNMIAYILNAGEGYDEGRFV